MSMSRNLRLRAAALRRPLPNEALRVVETRKERSGAGGRLRLRKKLRAALDYNRGLPASRHADAPPGCPEVDIWSAGTYVRLAPEGDMAVFIVISDISFIMAMPKLPGDQDTPCDQLFAIAGHEAGSFFED